MSMSSTAEGLNYAERKFLVQRMTFFVDEPWEQHAQWATRRFGGKITGTDCQVIYTTFKYSEKQQKKHERRPV